MGRWPPYGGGREGRFDCIYMCVCVCVYVCYVYVSICMCWFSCMYVFGWRYVFVYV